MCEPHMLEHIHEPLSWMGWQLQEPFECEAAGAGS